MAQRRGGSGSAGVRHRDRDAGEVAYRDELQWFQRGFRESAIPWARGKSFSRSFYGCHMAKWYSSVGVLLLSNTKETKRWGCRTRVNCEHVGGVGDELVEETLGLAGEQERCITRSPKVQDDIVGQLGRQSRRLSMWPKTGYHFRNIMGGLLRHCWRRCRS